LGQKTLPSPVFAQLQARLATATGFASYVAIQQWLREALALEVPYQPCMVSCVTNSRRSSSDHTLAMQKNAVEAVDFVTQCPRRLGLHLPVRRRLTGYGVKPVQVVEPLYESYWLYAALELTTGEACWWEFPRLDADCFTIFLSRSWHCYAESLNIVFL
jgi:hypothetical protein